MRLAAGDARFGDFRLWHDRNGDGLVDPGEVLELAAAGVGAIELKAQAVAGEARFGDVVAIQRGRYQRTDGSYMDLLDAALTYFSGAASGPPVALRFGARDLDGDNGQYLLTYERGAVTLNRRGRVPVSELIGPATLMRFRNTWVGMLSALVIDLDGNGLSLADRDTSGASFDMNGDGVLDRTGWTARGDGLLVIDRNGDGRITDASELSLLTATPGARNASEALIAFDMNGDGVLDARDARFGELAVWRDLNGNGVSEAGELMTLEALGITAIDLNLRYRAGAAGLGGNVTLSLGGCRRRDGSGGSFGEVALAFTPGAGRTAPVSASAVPATPADRPIVVVSPSPAPEPAPAPDATIGEPVATRAGAPRSPEAAAVSPSAGVMPASAADRPMVADGRLERPVRVDEVADVQPDVPVQPAPELVWAPELVGGPALTVVASPVAELAPPAPLPGETPVEQPRGEQHRVPTPPAELVWAPELTGGGPAWVTVTLDELIAASQPDPLPGDLPPAAIMPNRHGDLLLQSMASFGATATSDALARLRPEDRPLADLSAATRSGMAG